MACVAMGWPVNAARRPARWPGRGGRRACRTITGMSIDQMLADNQRFAQTYSPGVVPSRPRRKLAVVLCMDARIDPMRTLGLQTGDAHILRNAGGRVVDAVRSLVISQTQLGTREVAIIHHTECGLLTFRDDDIRATIRAELGVDASHIAFLPFSDLDQAVRDDLAYYRQQPLLRQDIPVRGFVYDVATGLLREVVEAEAGVAQAAG